MANSNTNSSMNRVAGLFKKEGCFIIFCSPFVIRKF
jgi:hypothetical protein